MGDYTLNYRMAFCHDKKNPDYYIIFLGIICKDLNNILVQRLNRTGEYKDRGWTKKGLGVELVHTFDFKCSCDDDYRDKFLDFVSEHIATEYIKDNFFITGSWRAWCKFESLEPEKWQKEFFEYRIKQAEELKKRSQPKVTQPTLF